MNITVDKSEVSGRVRAPSSKSYTIRGLVSAALARGNSEIVYPLGSDDTDATIGVLSQIGVHVGKEGASWLAGGGHFRQPAADLFCGDSAATLRFMAAVCSLVPGRCRLTTGPSLARRPVRPLVAALRQLGVDSSCQGDVAPVIVNGGRLRGGITRLPGNISSQFVSALLFISPLAEQGVTVSLTTPLESRPYVLMTLDCLEKFGIQVAHSPDLTEYKVSRQAYRPARYEVEGDWSSASYLLALGAVGGEVTVENLNPRSLQGDKKILDFLREMGALVDIKGNSVTVRRSALRAIKADLSDCIDLLPTVAVLAAQAIGISELTGTSRARLKESNRVSAVKAGLSSMGVGVIEAGDRLTIGSSAAKGAVIDSQGDHRIAMAFSIFGAVTGGVLIEGAECVAKTFPDFWDTVKRLGVRWAKDE